MEEFCIGLFVVLGILDVLLVLGSIKLEKMREKNERTRADTQGVSRGTKE